MAGPIEDSFKHTFADFLLKLRPYSDKQKKELFPLVNSALNTTLSSYGKPISEERAAAAATQELTGFEAAKFRKWLDDLEFAMIDRMLTLGYEKYFFHKFDRDMNGSMSPLSFKAAMAAVGVYLTDAEVLGLTKKYALNGELCYDDLWRYNLARREHVDKSTANDAFSKSLLSRPVPKSDEIDSLLSSLEVSQPFEVRLHRGLSQLREAMYKKSSNFFSLFQSLQNNDKEAAVVDILPQLEKLGFPAGVCSTQELQSGIETFAQTKAGYLTYTEFLAFFAGQYAASSEPSYSFTVDSAALVETLTKLNSLNLRKIFKAVDSDNDGLISVKELCGLLSEHGLTRTIVDNPEFHEYLFTFSRRKEGVFGYAEFIKFVNVRAQPTVSRSTVAVTDDMTPSQAFDLISSQSKSTSLESVLRHFDIDDDGRINETEFYNAVLELGVQISSAACKAVFEALGPKDGAICITEFSRIAVNPHKQTRFSTRVRHAPGGESNVPLGSYQHDTAPTPNRKQSIRILDTPSKASHFDGAAGVNQQAEFRPSIRPNYASTIQSSIELGYNPEPSTPNKSPVDHDGKSARRPPGDFSQVNFGRDHGAPASAARATTESKLDLLAYAPETKSPRNPRPFTAGGSTTVSLSFDENAPVDVVRPSYAVTQTPGGRTSVSIAMNESESHRPLVKNQQPTGGRATVEIAYDPAVARANGIPIAESRHYDKTVMSDLLDSDKNSVPASGPRQLRGVETAPKDKIDLDHPNQAPVLNNHRSSLRTFEPLDRIKNLGNDESAAIIQQFKEDRPIDVESAIFHNVVNAIYQHNQRVRQTFQEFNKSNNPTLCKAHFKLGLASLGLDVDDAAVDGIYLKFDTDLDNELTYSEFVRMLAFKDSVPNTPTLSPSASEEPSF